MHFYLLLFLYILCFHYNFLWKVLCYTCVPYIGAGEPRQCALETAEEVEDCPSKNHNVVDIQVDDYYLRCNANPWEYHKLKKKVRQIQCYQILLDILQTVLSLSCVSEEVERCTKYVAFFFTHFKPKK